MSRQISAAELAAVVTRLLASPNCPVEVSGAETFEAFMTDIARVVCKHCGGEVRYAASQQEDAWYIDIHGDNRLPDDCGIWREFDPEGDLSDATSATTGEHSDSVAPEAPTQASADPSAAMIHYTGYLAHDGVRVEADFRVPADASTTETDAAFLAALAMVADVNYLELGRLDAAEDTESRRGIFDEALNAKFVSIGDGQLLEMGARQDLIAQQVLQSYPADTVIGRDLYDDNPDFGNCFNWMQDRFEFPAWEGRTIGEFIRTSGIHTDQSTTNVISFTMPGYYKPRTLHATLQEMKDAQPLPDGGWLVRSELELRFHHKAGVPCQPAYA